MAKNQEVEQALRGLVFLKGQALMRENALDQKQRPGIFIPANLDEPSFHLTAGCVNCQI